MPTGRGGELISEVAVAMQAGMSVKELAATTHPYPSYAMCLQVLATNIATDDFLKSTAGKFVKRRYR